MVPYCLEPIGPSYFQDRIFSFIISLISNITFGWLSGQATKFLIVNGKLMPPLSSIDGMGEKAAEAVAEASKDGTYLSLDDFRQRTKASKTVIDTMVDLGILADLPASNQLSLFDF